MEEIRNLKPVAQNEKPVPSAGVKVTSEWYEVTVGEGNYEIYVDKERHCFVTQDQPREVIIPMQPGTHRLDVYSQGRFITPEGGVIGVFGEEEPEQPKEEPEAETTPAAEELEPAPDHPAEEPAHNPEPEQTAEEPEKTVSVSVDTLRVLFAHLMDAAACVEALLNQEGE